MELLADLFEGLLVVTPVHYGFHKLSIILYHLLLNNALPFLQDPLLILKLNILNHLLVLHIFSFLSLKNISLIGAFFGLSVNGFFDYVGVEFVVGRDIHLLILCILIKYTTRLLHKWIQIVLQIRYPIYMLTHLFIPLLKQLSFK